MDAVSAVRPSPVQAVIMVSAVNSIPARKPALRPGPCRRVDGRTLGGESSSCRTRARLVWSGKASKSVALNGKEPLSSKPVLRMVLAVGQARHFAEKIVLYLDGNGTVGMIGPAPIGHDH